MTLAVDLMGPLELVSAPGLVVVSRNQARKQVRLTVDQTQEDDLLDGYLLAAQTYCEQDISGNRQIGPAVFNLQLCNWWDGELIIPRPPTQAVSITYYDADDAQQTLATTVYETRLPWRQPGYIALKPDQEFPTLSDAYNWPITIQVTAGYLAPFTAVAATDVLTSTGRAFNNGQRVRVYNVGGALPAGLSADTNYWVISASGQTLKLSTAPGGSAVDVTDTGTGLHYVGEVPQTVQQAILMLAGHFFETRVPVLVGSISKELEFAVTNLLHAEGWGSYR